MGNAQKWIESELVGDAMSRLDSIDLYVNYCAWSMERQIYPISHRALARELLACGGLLRRGAQGKRMFTGFRFRKEGEI